MAEVVLSPPPFIVVVSGTPGSGKTTMAVEIAKALHLPLISRDDIKTGLHVTHQADSPSDVHRFSDHAFNVFYDVVRLLARSGCSVVAEAAFHRDASAPQLSELMTEARCVQVHTSISVQLAAKRYRERAERGERHPAHADLLFAEHMTAGDFDWDRFDPSPTGMPLLTVRTDDGYDPPIDQVVAWIRTNVNG